MNSETFFTLLLLLVYLLFQFASRKKRPAQQPGPKTPQPYPRPERGPVAYGEDEEALSLEEALREIRSVLGGEAPPPEPTRKAEPLLPRPPLSRPEEPVFAEDRFERLPRSTQYQAPPVRYEAPPPVPARATPLRQKTARTPAVAGPSASSPILAGSLVGSDIEVQRVAPQEPAVETAALVRRLRQPEAAREAFLLSEILGRPHSKRSR